MLTNCLLSGCRSGSLRDELDVNDTRLEKKRISFSANQYGNFENFENSANYSEFINQFKEDLAKIASKVNCEYDYEGLASRFLEFLQNPMLIDKTTKGVLYQQTPAQLAKMIEVLDTLDSKKDAFTFERISASIKEIFSDSEICLPGILNNICNATHAADQLSMNDGYLFQYSKERLAEQTIIRFIEEMKVPVPYHNHWAKAFKDSLDGTVFEFTYSKQDDIFITDEMKNTVKNYHPVLMLRLSTAATSEQVLLSMAEDLLDRARSYKMPSDNERNLSSESISNIYRFASNSNMDISPESLLDYEPETDTFRFQNNHLYLAQDITRSLCTSHPDLKKTLQEIHFKKGNEDHAIYAAGGIWWYEVNGKKKTSDFNKQDFISLDYTDTLPECFVEHLLNEFPLDTVRSLWKKEWLTLDNQSSLLFKFFKDVDVFKFLLEQDTGGALFSRHCLTRLTPLHEAILLDSNDILDVIFSHKYMHVALMFLRCGIEQIPLHLAIDNSNVHAFNKIINLGYFRPGLLDIQDRDGNTVLHYAVYNKDHKMMAELIKKLTVNNKHQEITNNSGHTAFHCAVESRDVDIIRTMFNSHHFSVKDLLSSLNTDDISFLMEYRDLREVISDFL